MPRERKTVNQKEKLVSFRITADIQEKLDRDAKEIDISPSQFARNIILKYYREKNARLSEPSYVQETTVQYSEMDKPTLKLIIKEELANAIENMILSDEMVDKFLNELSNKALEKLIKK